MTYREQLNKVEELGISICDLEIANELDEVLDFNYTEDEFESLCAFGVEIYRKAETMTANAIACCINDIVKKQRALSFRTTNRIIEEILKMDKWDFISEASNYLV